jgi:hypothetical protein
LFLHLKLIQREHEIQSLCYFFTPEIDSPGISLIFITGSKAGLHLFLFALAQQHLRALNFALSAKKAIGRDATPVGALIANNPVTFFAASATKNIERRASARSLRFVHSLLF